MRPYTIVPRSLNLFDVSPHLLLKCRVCVCVRVCPPPSIATLSPCDKKAVLPPSDSHGSNFWLFAPQLEPATSAPITGRLALPRCPPAFVSHSDTSLRCSYCLSLTPQTDFSVLSEDERVHRSSICTHHTPCRSLDAELGRESETRLSSLNISLWVHDGHREQTDTATTEGIEPYFCAFSLVHSAS